MLSPGQEAALERGHLHSPGWNLTPSAAPPAKPTPLKAASRTNVKMKGTRTRASPRADPTPGSYAGKRTEASLRAWRTRWRWDRGLCGEIPGAVGEAVILHTFSCLRQKEVVKAVPQPGARGAASHRWRNSKLCKLNR